MAINELVTAIQTIHSPPGRIPQPRKSREVDTKGLPPELTPIERSAVPDWVESEKGVLLPTEGTIACEQQISPVAAGLPPPIEAIAYYLPFHFYKSEWGIYLRASGIVSVASMLASALGTGVTQDLLDVAYRILLQHERFHFSSEVACARVGLLFQTIPYPDYFNDGGATALEEALCNAHAFRTALRKQPPTVRQKVKKWMQSQGNGYRDFDRCLTPSRFLKWVRIAIDRMLSQAQGGFFIGKDGLSAPGTSTTPGNIWIHGQIITSQGRTIPVPTEFLFSGLTRLRPPVFVVLDEKYFDVLRPFPKYAGVQVRVHTHDHPPPHIHVEIPPGHQITRLKWPELTPLEGNSPLSNRQRKSLDKYLSRYKNVINEKIQQIYHPAV